MKVVDYFNVPYLMESEAHETADGGWTRSVRYPELPGAVAEAPSIEDAITMLERRRIEVILDYLRSGQEPPIPRPPLVHDVTNSTLARIGAQDVTSLLGLDAAELATEVK